MRNTLKTNFNLHRLVCHDEADGWGSAEPYMWTVYFKIDGSTCRLNESLMLEGTATIFPTPGSHGNLGDTDVDEGDTVAIPVAIGSQEMTLTPIPVPDFVKALGTDDVTAIAGCIVVLNEEDNVSDAGAEAGHQALNVAIQNALDSLIPSLGFSNQQISDSDIENITNSVQAQVESAVQNQQNFFQNLWSWLNADDTIGTVVWKFSGDELLDETPVSLQKRWSNGNGDWELFGTIDTIELPSCPAEVVQEIFDSLFGKSSSEETMKSMRDFRSVEMYKYKGLHSWWEIAQRNSHYLKMALKDKEISEAAMSIFKDIPEILKKKERPLSEGNFNSVGKILDRMLEISAKDRQSRKDIRRSIDALSLLKGKSPLEIFEALSRVKPARYPRNLEGWG